jgi:phosphoglucosamine mutase
MTGETSLRLGQAAGLMFVRGQHRHQVVIGKDTRLSGYMIEPALVAGFIAAGMDVTLVGPLPTPAIAMLTRSLRADLGVMISASHNTYEDNGIKLFGPDGFKLSDETELEIEALMEADLSGRLAAPGRLGRAARLNDAAGRYIEAAKATFPRGHTLDGLKIVVDCANGAGYKVAPTVLWELGATIIPLGVDPDGFNINRDCGSTVPGLLQQKVVEHKADLGIALDGDADRLLLVDERGEMVDGDQILALIARSWRQAGRLQGGGVVATVMSNLGLERFLAKEGLKLHRTRVGDRYVVEQMRAQGMNVGGEQSGHVIMSDFATTGDGLVAALQVLAVLVDVGRPASEVCSVFAPLPQLLRNVRFVIGSGGRSPLETPGVKAAVQAAEARLGKKGRLLLRLSGTEPLVRVMAEGEDEALVTEIVGNLCDTIQAAAEQAA